MSDDGTGTVQDGPLTKVRFFLEPDDDGWPPATSEGLWAEQVGPDLYRLDNTPWYARGVSYNDIVRAVPGDDGRLEAVGVEQAGGHMTIRLIPSGPGDRAELMPAVGDAFRALGASWEGDQTEGILAIDIPPSADHPELKRILVEGYVADRWDYKESDITQEWLDL